MNVRFPALSPHEAEIVEAFEDALREVREQELERAWLAVHALEVLRDGLAELAADLDPAATGCSAR
jgi:hypothetical protein